MPFQPGNKHAQGGKRAMTGPKPLEVRALCAIEFAKRVPILCKIADDKKNRPIDRIAAVKELARVGIGDKMELVGKDDGPIQTETNFDHDSFLTAFQRFAAGRLSSDGDGATAGDGVAESVHPENSP